LIDWFLGHGPLTELKAAVGTVAGVRSLWNTRRAAVWRQAGRKGLPVAARVFDGLYRVAA
jgi:hypothetical protein